MQRDLLNLQKNILIALLPEPWELATCGCHAYNSKNWFSIWDVQRGRIVSVESDPTLPASRVEQMRGLAFKLAATGVVS